MTGIGKEKPKLKAKSVVVQHIGRTTIEPKEGGKMKEARDKYILSCKHPDKEEPIEISRVRFEKGTKMETQALWDSRDDEDLISYDSAMAHLLRFYELNMVEELEGKTLQTVTDINSGFLIIKAY